MKKINVFILSGVALSAIIVFSAFSIKSPILENEYQLVEESAVEQQQMVNLFVTHGHCSTPFSGIVRGLNVVASDNAENPLENMQLSFEIDPESFVCGAGEELTSRVKTPGVFVDSKHQETMKFKSTRVYTMGVDWYEVNGVLSIKGVENEVKFYVSGIREPNETMASKIVLEGKIDLTDWGINYDKQVYRDSNENPTRWMHINMKIDLPLGC